jgi:hypothetical protein
MQEDAKKQLVDKIKTANNILVTVSRNPSVDQLAALLGLTLVLNKDGKHAAAIFSGEVPSTIEFLQPEETFEKNTDSLRDFIIALDKNKADKLRYKVEDDVVRIFITPYKTSISQEDFEFSQGDFNVDLIIAIGVREQTDFDEAIMAHGRILHDATLASITTTSDAALGAINWHESGASSLSEMVTALAQDVGHDLLDQQVSTALLTGIVAETDRFSNEKTTQQTMSMSALLMGSGANQQLVATKLAEPISMPKVSDDKPESADDAAQSDADDMPKDDKPAQSDDGSIEIDHDHDAPSDDDKTEPPSLELPTPDEPADDSPSTENTGPDNLGGLSTGSRYLTEPPAGGGTLTASIENNEIDPVTDPFSMPGAELPQLMDHKNDVQPLPPVAEDTTQYMGSPADQPTVLPPADDTSIPTVTPPTDTATPEPTALPTLPEPPAVTSPPETPTPDPSPAPDPFNLHPADASVPSSDPTLAQLEHSIDSPHAEGQDVDAARSEVDQALNEATATGTMPPAPIQALGAQPMVDNLNPSTPPTAPPPTDQGTAAVADPNAPPPVPPPIPFNFGSQPPQH